MIKPLLAHTDHLHHLKNVKNEEKIQVKNHHDQMKQHQINQKSKKNESVKTIVAQPVFIKNDAILQSSNLIAPLTLGEYIFSSMIASPFVLYLIKRKILR